MANIGSALAQDITAKQELLESYLKILLIELTEYKKREIVLVDNSAEEGQEILRRFNGLVEDNYARWHQIGPYAEKFGISATSFTKKLSNLVFRQARSFTIESLFKRKDYSTLHLNR